MRGYLYTHMKDFLCPFLSQNWNGSRTVIDIYNTVVVIWKRSLQLCLKENAPISLTNLCHVICAAEQGNMASAPTDDSLETWLSKCRFPSLCLDCFALLLPPKSFIIESVAASAIWGISCHVLTQYMLRYTYSAKYWHCYRVKDKAKQVNDFRI